MLDRWHARGRRCASPGSGENPLLDKVLEPLLDDLNTPLAIAALHHMAEEVADDHEGDDRAMFRAALQPARPAAGDRDGVAELAAGRRRRSTRRASATLIEARSAARAARNFAEADRIRGELDAMGVRAEGRAGGHDLGGEAMSEFRLTGGCQCGAVRYALARTARPAAASAIAACARRRSARSSRRSSACR